MVINWLLIVFLIIFGVAAIGESSYHNKRMYAIIFSLCLIATVVMDMMH